jgi:hypothetical protein
MENIKLLVIREVLDCVGESVIAITTNRVWDRCWEQLHDRVEDLVDVVIGGEIYDQFRDQFLGKVTW